MLTHDRRLPLGIKPDALLRVCEVVEAKRRQCNDEAALYPDAAQAVMVFVRQLQAVMGLAISEHEARCPLATSQEQDELAMLHALVASEREMLHAIIQECDAVIDPEQHPELSSRIDAVLLPCDEAGHCPSPNLGTQLPIRRA